ncbi:hypothetical protein [Lysinibacillus varians]|uniref:Uncharacterized protein n=1 Tax=Lysinibacillus varians TaxID=1145276 RepID=A0ABY2T7X4_9BACI|nr:hypothetical protein [Lysinibacillus varians]AHN24481.1 hypothetical protein T479_20025 [Lysinibacillus varians]TKI60503.1 hypothetical protein FC752_15050 [Lysinibacillus varians]
MAKIKKVEFIEAFSAYSLRDFINEYLEKNPRENVVDIKFNVYLEEIDPVHLEEDEDPKQNRFGAFLLIGDRD